MFPEAAALQVRAADESSGGGQAAAFPAGSTYSVSLPGGQAGRCLTQASSSSSGGSGGTPVTLSAVKPDEQQGDGIYCGPLQGAPLAPAAEAAAGSGSTGSDSTGSDSTGSSSADTAQQQQQQPAPQLNEVRSGASCGRPGMLTALVAVAALLAGAVVAA